MVLIIIIMIDINFSHTNTPYLYSSSKMYLLALLLTCGLLYYLFRRSNPYKRSKSANGRVRKPIEEILKRPENIRYSRKDVSSPVMSGVLLTVLSRIQHTVFGKNVIIPLLRKANDLDVVFDGEFIPEKATFTPIAISCPIRSKQGSNNNTILKSLVDNHTPNPCVTSCVDFYNAYKSGRCDPMAVAKGVLQFIEVSNNSNSHPPLRAIVKCNDREVLRMAQESADRWSNGKPRSYLDGVPVSIKDCYAVIPYECFVGASFKPAAVEGMRDKESTLVTRLKDAGAIIIGLANLQELCAGITGSNHNEAFQIARNPYNIEHCCGGSSSGSASSVAAGLCAISIGSDAGGSIRIPAAHCGVVGLKPTFNLLETTGVVSHTQTVGVPGPLAATALDTAIVMDILCSENHLLDLSGLESTTLEGIKLGVYWEFFEHADEEIVAACKLAVDKLTSLGAECVEIKIPELLETNTAHVKTVAAEFSLSIGPDFSSNFHSLCGETVLLTGLGYTVTGAEYVNCQKQRTRAIRVLEILFEEVDVILTPSTACLAPKIPNGGDKYGFSSNQILACSTRFACLANLTGIPGISVPVGISSTGLPISLQIVGPWYEEGRLIHIANQLEKEVATELTRPKVHYDVLDYATQ